MTVDVKSLLKEGAELTDHALEELLPCVKTVPASIHGAMRHSIFAGGKRLRPVLAMQAGVTIAGELPKGIEKLGAALEMLHTYSLIHDDLPALDNDDLRRGKPTCHVAFGEAIAILAGDALQTRAFEVLAGLDIAARRDRADHRPHRQRRGHGGRHDRRTGAGSRKRTPEAHGEDGGGDSPRQDRRADPGERGGGRRLCRSHLEDVARLTMFGCKAGLAFQIVDDVLDMTVDSAQLGKTAGKDQATEKATWPAVYGIEQSQRDAARLIEEAFAALEPYGSRADGLKAVARYLVERKN